MTLRSTDDAREDLLDDVYASAYVSVGMPKYRFPNKEHAPRGAYSVVHDELLLDGNSRQNLATFCQTWTEPEVHQLMDECLDKNMIDKDESPQTAEIEAPCVHMLADLWNAPDAAGTLGCSTTGSSEAAIFGGRAMKWRWCERMKAQGKPTDKPNLIAGRVQICWPCGRRIFHVLGLACSLLIVLQACTKLGPDFESPVAPLQDDWLEATEGPLRGEPAEISTWWQVLNEPILSNLIEIAYRQNLTLQAAGLRVLEARARLGIAVGDQYPQVQEANGSYTYNWVSKNAPNAAVTDRSFEDLTVGVDASWEIDFWGKFARAIESSNASLGATIANHDDFLVILTAEVARFYIIVREAEERIRLARDNVEIQKRSLEIAQLRYRAGAVSELDVQQAQALLAETRARIPALRIQRRQAQNALAVLLGMPPSRLVESLGDEGAIPTAPKEIAVGIPAELLRRRPDIRRAELVAAAQSAQIGIAEAELYPAFTLGGFVGFQTSDNVDARSNNADRSDLLQGSSFTGFVGPSLSWPFLNYGRLTNNVRVQDARFQALIADYQNTVLEAYREVEDGLVGFLRSQEQAELLATSVTATKKAVDLALVQYREGIADYQRVLDTQTGLLTRQESLAVSQSGIAQNLVLTYRGLGGGWQIRGPNDFVPRETIEVMRHRTDWGDILPPSDLQDAPESGIAASEADSFFRRPDF